MWAKGCVCAMWRQVGSLHLVRCKILVQVEELEWWWRRLAHCRREERGLEGRERRLELGRDEREGLARDAECLPHPHELRDPSGALEAKEGSVEE